MEEFQNSWSRASDDFEKRRALPGFNRLGKDNYKMRREAFKLWNLVRLILETLRYIKMQKLQSGQDSTETWTEDKTEWNEYIYILLPKSYPPRQNGCHFADNIFKGTFMNEMFWISLPISLKFVPKVPIDKKSALVQVMDWHQTSNKSLPEPMLTQFTEAWIGHQREIS